MARKKLSKPQQDVMDAIKAFYFRDKRGAINFISTYFVLLCEFLPLADPDYDLLGFIFDDIRNMKITKPKE